MERDDDAHARLEANERLMPLYEYAILENGKPTDERWTEFQHITEPALKKAPDGRPCARVPQLTRRGDREWEGREATSITLPTVRNKALQREIMENVPGITFDDVGRVVYKSDKGQREAFRAIGALQERFDAEDEEMMAVHRDDIAEAMKEHAEEAADSKPVTEASEAMHSKLQQTKGT